MEKPPKTTKHEKTLENFAPASTSETEIPDYIQKEIGEGDYIQPDSGAIGIPIPTSPIETISDFEAPDTTWLSSDKLRVISYLIWGATSRQRIDDILLDLAKVMLAAAPPDEAKRVAGAYLQFQEQKELEKQNLRKSLYSS